MGDVSQVAEDLVAISCCAVLGASSEERHTFHIVASELANSEPVLVGARRMRAVPGKQAMGTARRGWGVVMEVEEAELRSELPGRGKGNVT